VQQREQVVRDINEHFDEMVQDILDPQPEVDLSKNPFFAAGQAGLERLKWDYRTSGVVEG
jgi:hypothetical protein